MVRKNCDVELKKIQHPSFRGKKFKTRQTEEKNNQDPVIFFPTQGSQ